MNVKLLCGRVGIRKSQAPGEVVEVPDDEGERMIAAGQATLAPEVAALAGASERAVRPVGRPRKG